MRRLLLDTHAFLWWLADSTRLGQGARLLIEAPVNEIFVSAASVLEIAIKRRNGKLDAPDGLGKIVEEDGFTPLPIGLDHVELAGSLPTIHKDPFDRLLIAQSKIEGLELISADSVFPEYQVRLVNAEE